MVLTRKKYTAHWKGIDFNVETLETNAGEIEDFEIYLPDSYIEIYEFLSLETIDGIMNNLEEE
jgi:hypothetical protein